jgi:hypothetical protein
MARFLRSRAVALTGFGVFTVVVPTFGLMTYEPNAWAQRPVRVVAFLATFWSLGAILCVRGWWQLRQEKKNHAPQTWVQFLREDLAVMVVAIALMIGISRVPQAKLDALMNAFHELEMTLTAARGGHP